MANLKANMEKRVILSITVSAKAQGGKRKRKGKIKCMLRKWMLLLVHSRKEWKIGWNQIVCVFEDL